MKKNLLLLLTVFTFSAHLFAQIPTGGLVAHYKFNGNANDESGKGNNGLSFGAKLTSDRAGTPNQAYWFNGENSSVLVPSSATLAVVGDKTISTWVRIDSANIYKPYPTIISKEISNATFPTFDIMLCGDLFGQDSYKITSYFGNNSTNYSVFTANFYPKYINQWINITSVYSQIEGALSIYVNDTLRGSSNIGYKFSNFDNNVPVSIGKGYISTGNTHFKGSIDDIAIYNRALTRSEITQLFKDDPTAVSATKREESYKIYAAKNSIVIAKSSLVGEEKFVVRNAVGQIVKAGVLTDISTTYPINGISASKFYIVQILNKKNQVVASSKVLVK